MNTFQQKFGPWALVTGASSGIGAEFCRQLAPKGINLVMVARRKERMEQLVGELRNKHDVQTKVIQADLSKNDFMQTLLPEISSLEIGLLVNNAGFGIRGAFLNSNLERELEMLNVNCRAPLILTHVIGRQMMQRKKLTTSVQSVSLLCACVEVKSELPISSTHLMIAAVGCDKTMGCTKRFSRGLSRHSAKKRQPWSATSPKSTA